MHLADVVERHSTPQGSPSSSNQITPTKGESQDHTSLVLVPNPTLENGSNKSSGSSPSLFKQRHGKSLAISYKEDVQVPIASSIPANSVETPSKGNRLGTVSFYSNVTNCRSPRMALISPSHKSKPLVQLQDGENVPYEDWWRKMRRWVVISSSGCVCAQHICLCKLCWPEQQIITSAHGKPSSFSNFRTMFMSVGFHFHRLSATRDISLYFFCMCR